MKKIFSILCALGIVMGASAVPASQEDDVIDVTILSADHGFVEEYGEGLYSVEYQLQCYDYDFFFTFQLSENQNDIELDKAYTLADMRAQYCWAMDFIMYDEFRISAVSFKKSLDSSGDLVYEVIVTSEAGDQYYLHNGNVAETYTISFKFPTENYPEHIVMVSDIDGHLYPEMTYNASTGYFDVEIELPVVEWEEVYFRDANNEDIVLEAVTAGSWHKIYYTLGRVIAEGDKSADLSKADYRWTPTGDAVENTAIEVKAVKRIENGQIVIEKNGKNYNALGAEVK